MIICWKHPWHCPTVLTANKPPKLYSDEKLWKKREKPSRFQQGLIKFKQQKCGAFITGVHCCCTTLMWGWFASRKGKNKCHWNGNRWGRWNPRQNSHFSAPQLYEIYGAAIMNHRTDRASLMIPGITLLGCAVFLVEVGGRKGLVPFRLLCQPDKLSPHFGLIERTTKGEREWGSILTCMCIYSLTIIQRPQ